MSMKVILPIFAVACALLPGATHAQSASRRTFPNGVTISLEYEPAGIGGTGTIIRRQRGQSVRRVTIDYMREFTGIPAENQVRYVVSGVTDRGEESIACVATIDWRRARVVARRRLGRSTLTC